MLRRPLILALLLAPALVTAQGGVPATTTEYTDTLDRRAQRDPLDAPPPADETPEQRAARIRALDRRLHYTNGAAKAFTDAIAHARRLEDAIRAFGHDPASRFVACDEAQVDQFQALRADGGPFPRFQHLQQVAVILPELAARAEPTEQWETIDALAWMARQVMQAFGAADRDLTALRARAAQQARSNRLPCAYTLDEVVAYAQVGRRVRQDAEGKTQVLPPQDLDAHRPDGTTRSYPERVPRP
jgi:hypothetical protein